MHGRGLPALRKRRLMTVLRRVPLGTMMEDTYASSGGLRDGIESIRASCSAAAVVASAEWKHIYKLSSSATYSLATAARSASARSSSWSSGSKSSKLPMHNAAVFPLHRRDHRLHRASPERAASSHRISCVKRRRSRRKNLTAHSARATSNIWTKTSARCWSLSPCVSK